MNPHRLYRSRDRQLAGVAGGMAEYLAVDPTIIRIGWILVTLFTGGLALIAYLLLALIIPNPPYGMVPGASASWPGQPAPGAGWGTASGETTYGSTGYGQPPSSGQATSYGQPSWGAAPATPAWYPPAGGYESSRTSRGLGAAGIVGIVLVVIGGIALADVTLPGLRVGMLLGPAVILALGVALVLSSVRRPVEPHVDTASSVAAVDPAQAASAPVAQTAWSSTPAEMQPWPSSNPAPASSPTSTPVAATDDPDATMTDVPTVQSPSAEGDAGRPA